MSDFNSVGKQPLQTTGMDGGIDSTSQAKGSNPTQMEATVAGLGNEAMKSIDSAHESASVSDEEIFAKAMSDIEKALADLDDVSALEAQQSGEEVAGSANRSAEEPKRSGRKLPEITDAVKATALKSSGKAEAPPRPPRRDLEETDDKDSMPSMDDVMDGESEIGESIHTDLTKGTEAAVAKETVDKSRFSLSNLKSIASKVTSAVVKFFSSKSEAASQKDTLAKINAHVQANITEEERTVAKSLASSSLDSEIPLSEDDSIQLGDTTYFIVPPGTKGKEETGKKSETFESLSYIIGTVDSQKMTDEFKSELKSYISKLPSEEERNELISLLQQKV